MLSDTLYACYYTDPCSSTAVITPDMMCDSTFQFDNAFSNAATAESCDFRQADVEVDSLMRTLYEDPDFFDSIAFSSQPPPMTLQGGYGDDFGANEQSRMFATEFYEPSPTTRTPVASPDPSPSEPTPAHFEEFSLATQLPGLNDYTTAPYAISEATPTMVNSVKYENFEPYSAQYFFTTPPDTPPSMYPTGAPMTAHPASCVRRTTSSISDPTPTIRKLLQQKKKRIAAVPCHINSVCTTCQTRTTSLWRRNHLGEIECNACNLYFRKNNCKRPATLRKDEIMKRKRKPRVDPTQSNDTTTTSCTTIDVKPTLFT